MRLGKASFIKPAKHALRFTVLVLVVGLLMDGDYKRLMMAGGAGLILLAGGLVAEWIRPTPTRADRPDRAAALPRAVDGGMGE